MYFSFKKLVWLAILIYVLVFGIISILRHQQFKTQVWDMAIFNQTMWNTVHGRVMQNSIEEISNHLGVHMSPFLFVLLPGYALFPSPYFLLIIQTVALALGAFPLFLLAKKYIKERLAFIIVLAYLLYPSLHSINLFDFHPIAFLIPTLLAGFYFLELRRWLWASLFLILAISTKEDAVLAVMFIGLFLLARKIKFKEIKNIFKKDWWEADQIAGLTIFLVSLIYFVLTVKVFMPAFGGGLLRADRYAHLGSNIYEMIGNIFINPKIYIDTIFIKSKLIYLLWLFAPLLFIPLFSWRSIVLLVPGLLENLLTNYTSQFSSIYQYDSILIPGLFIGLVMNLPYFLKKQKEKREIWFTRIFATVIIVIFFIHSPIVSKNMLGDLIQIDEQEKAYHLMVESVPDEVSVAAYTRLVPHISNRASIAMLGYERAPADVLLVDAYNHFGFSDSQSFQNHIDNYMNSGQYAVKIIEDRYLIVYRKDIKLNLTSYE